VLIAGYNNHQRLYSSKIFSAAYCGSDRLKAREKEKYLCYKDEKENTNIQT